MRKARRSPSASTTWSTRSADGADELVLEVGVADEDAGLFHAGSLEGAAELTLLAGVAEAPEPDVEPVRAVLGQEAPDRLGAAHSDDGDAFGVEIPTVALGERLDGALVADPLDEHDSRERLTLERWV